MLKRLSFQGFQVPQQRKKELEEKMKDAHKKSSRQLMPKSSETQQRSSQYSDFAAQYYAKYAVQPTGPDLASKVLLKDEQGEQQDTEDKPHPSTEQFEHVGFEHYLQRALKSMAKTDKLSADAVRLLQEGLPADAENISKSTARLGLEWHKWRSLHSIFSSTKQVQRNTANFPLSTLLEAFEISSPPEAGFIAQMIAETREGWDLENLQFCARVVGGLLNNPANTGYDYAILSEACLAAFNVHTLSAELRLTHASAALFG
ncbi:unnamed protein product, partial [Amoebophrya sp. A25]|eukprot:GSA25T00019771001.1